MDVEKIVIDNRDDRDGYKFEGTPYIPGFEAVPNDNQRATRRGITYKDIFAYYFTTECTTYFESIRCIKCNFSRKRIH